MKNSILAIVLIVGLSNCSVKDVTSSSQPISHEVWDELLQKYVNEEGWVNYKGFIKDSTKMNRYLELLKNNHPNTKNWTRNERYAYWINAYNAFTVSLIMKHYPVASIKDIKNGIPFVNTVWDIKFIKIEGQTYDLNNLEHGIIRPKFKDARAHFAVNCASYSCPKLLNEAYTPAKLEEQLNQQARAFLVDKTKNIIENPASIQLSKIFSWYGGDFKAEKPLIDYINQYAPLKVNQDVNIEYLDYQWTLNEQKD